MNKLLNKICIGAAVLCLSLIHILFLMGASTGAAYAVANPGVADVKITQQTGTCTGIVKDENSFLPSAGLPLGLVECLLDGKEKELLDFQ